MEGQRRDGVQYDRDVVFFFQAEDGIRDYKVTGVQTCALPICGLANGSRRRRTCGSERLLLDFRSSESGWAKRLVALDLNRGCSLEISHYRSGSQIGRAHV